MTTDVWQLESSEQNIASIDVNEIIDTAFHGNFGERIQAIKYLRELWNNESWQSIKDKLNTEGSTWYVWYMDGVNHHLCHLQGIEHPSFH